MIDDPGNYFMDDKVPAGYCQCGCGQKTAVYASTKRSRGQVKGRPHRFIPGHQNTYYKGEDKQRKYLMPKKHFSGAGPFKISGVICRIIALTQDCFAIVEDEDFAWLNEYNWCAQWNPCTRSYYALRKDRQEGKWKTIYMHTAILGLSRGAKGDHVNGVTLLNTRTNLRPADSFQNAVNSKRRKDNTSGFKGVFWDTKKRRWRVRVQFHKKGYHGGFFDDPLIASIAHAELYTRVAGDFARERSFQ